MKHAAICETRYVGLVPHFTGPVAEAGAVRFLCAASRPAIMEMRGKGEPRARHLTEAYDFRSGKLFPGSKPGFGGEFDSRQADLSSEVTERERPITLYRRPDGPITNG